MTERTCAVCGCTDITACLERGGDPCCWVDDELCSACEEVISDDVLREVGEERRRQDLRWGGPELDDRYSPADWREIVDRLLDEADDASCGDDDAQAEYRRVMLQVAAVAVAAVQAHDRKAGAV